MSATGSAISCASCAAIRAHHRIAILPGPPCLNHVAYDMSRRRRHDAWRRPPAAAKASKSPGARAATRPATTPSAISSRPMASPWNTPPNSKRWIDGTWQSTVYKPAPRVMDHWGIGVGGPQTMPHPAPDRGPVPAGRDLSMALFEYFPGNYVWNLCRRHGARERRPDRRDRWTCAGPCAKPPRSGEDAGTAEFLAEWVKMAEKLMELAAEDEALGRTLSRRTQAGQRAALYLIVAERMQGHGHPGREATYARRAAGFSPRHSDRQRERRTRGSSATRARRCRRC